MTVGTSDTAKPRRLPELDALRGIAAMLVLLFHYSYQYPKLFPDQTGLPFRWQWAENGIWLFFAISGFVICMTLERTRHWTDFVWARFSRLYPVNWAAMALTVIEATLVAIIISAIFWLMLGGRLSLLASPMLLWLGAISYPLYLVHQNIGYVVIHQLGRAGVNIEIAVVAAAALAVVLAHVLHRHIEDSAQRWLRQRKLVMARGTIVATE